MNNRENIRRLQAMLNSTLRPSPNLVADGVMGSQTRAALARYGDIKAKISEGNVAPLIIAHGGPKPPTGNTATGGEESNAWMSIAEGELGTAEIAGAANNARIIAYHAATSLHAQTDEVPWCSSFVNWVMREAGKVGTNNALASSWVGWGRLTAARYGAITVIKKKSASSDAATGSSTGFHVGFLVEATPTRVRLLGGNQGDMVKLSGFYLSSYEVRAYRWPQ